MKKILFLVFLMGSVCSLKAQTGIFKTYEDYVNNKMEVMSDDANVTGTSLGLTYRFKTMDGSLVKYKPKDFWGFLLKGFLFRSVGNYTAMLQDSGKVSYFINGEAGVHSIRTGHGFGVTIVGPLYYLSSGGVNAEIYPMPRDGLDMRGLKKFKTDFPGYESLYSCLGKYPYYADIGKCVKAFNTSYKSK